MAYQRETSEIITDAQVCAAHLNALAPALDLGSGLTLAAFATRIAAAQTSLTAYNVLLAQTDAAGSEFKEVEQELRILSARMLAWGKDSRNSGSARRKRLFQEGVSWLADAKPRNSLPPCRNVPSYLKALAPALYLGSSLTLAAFATRIAAAQERTARTAMAAAIFCRASLTHPAPDCALLAAR